MDMDQQVDEYMKFLTSNEELHPDLEPYLHETSTLGNVLSHPLVYQVPFHSAALANRVYEHKKERLDSALKERDTHSFVFLHERPYRVQALSELQTNGLLLDDDEGRELVSSVWSDSENIWQNTEEWYELLGGIGLHWEDDERAAFEALPRDERGRITIYRGGIESDTYSNVTEDGAFSWTTSRETASWFARRFNDNGRRGTSLVATAKVHPRFVVGYLTGRGEAEVVVTAPEDLTIIRIETVEEFNASAAAAPSPTLVQYDEVADQWWVECAQGHTHYGHRGASALLLRTRDESNQTRVLVQQRGSGVDHAGMWAFPGGALEEGESSVDAAWREAFEEAAIERMACEVTTVTDDHGDWQFTVVIGDVPTPATVQAHPTPEGGATQWVALNELDAFDWMPGARGHIEKAIQESP